MSQSLSRFQVFSVKESSVLVSVALREARLDLNVPTGWPKGDRGCARGGCDEHQTAAKAAPASAQVRRIGEVDQPRGNGFLSLSWEAEYQWSGRQMYFMLRNVLSTLSSVYTGRAVWLTLWWLFLIVITPLMFPEFLLDFNKLLFGRFPGWPDDQMDGG